MGKDSPNLPVSCRRIGSHPQPKPGGPMPAGLLRIRRSVSKCNEIPEIAEFLHVTYLYRLLDYFCLRCKHA